MINIRYTNTIKQSPTNILNDQLHYKITQLDTIPHAVLLTPLVFQPPLLIGRRTLQSILRRLPSIDNGAHDIEKLLLKTQLSEVLYSDVNILTLQEQDEQNITI